MTIHGDDCDQPLRELLPIEVLRSDGLDPSAGLVLYRVKLYLQVHDETSQSTSNSDKAFQRGPHIAIFGQYGDSGRRMIAFTNPVGGTNEEDVKIFDCLLEAVYLGPLQRCTIGPVVANGNPTNGSLCVGVEVFDPMTGEMFHFPADV